MKEPFAFYASRFRSRPFSMNQLDPLAPEEYQAGAAGAAYYLLSEPGCLRVSGPDAQAFLQRQTTNDLASLAEGRALLTVLTSPAARILDVLILLREGPDIAVLALPGRGAQTTRFLRSRIFFADKVTVEDESAATAQVAVLGPLAGQALAEAGFARPTRPGERLSADLGGTPARLLHVAPFGYRLVIPADRVETALAALQKAGAIGLSPQVYEVLRVEAGLPGAGSELTGEYTPLETGLAEAVSTTKGCYTGQEVLARQITYDKVTRQMAGLLLEGEARSGDRLWPAGGGQPVGTVTSAVRSPRFGPIALAVLRRPFHQPGTQLLAGSNQEGAVAASVTALPFPG